MSDQGTFETFLSPTAPLSEVNRFRFLFRREMALIRTAMPVQVVAVHTTGGVAAAGKVDVQPLIQQTDGAGNVVSLPVLYGLPYSRWQGGTSAIILDPVVGDMGMAMFADRDASAVIAAQKLSPPGSNRRFSLADGFYVGMVLNQAPQQYVQLDPTAGVVIYSPTQVKASVGTGASAPTLNLTTTSLSLKVGSNGLTIDSAGSHFTGEVDGNSTATFSGEGTFNGGHTVSQHKHNVSGVQTGGSTVPSQTPTG